MSDSGSPAARSRCRRRSASYSRCCLRIATPPRGGDVRLRQTCTPCCRDEGETVDLTTLRREAENRVSGVAGGIDRAGGHHRSRRMAAAARGERTWDFWDRYRRYLEEVKLMPRQVVWRIDETTDQVLRKLEDPPGPAGGAGTGWSSGRSSPARPPTTSA